jgi:type I restriction enzyme R subunit
MKQTDTTEKGLESLIVASLVNESGYLQGDPKDYDREHAVDLTQLLAFLSVTQPDALESLGLSGEGPKRTQFLHRLQGEIAKRGVVDVLRGGIRHGPANIDLFYGTPSPGNLKAAERFAANIFSVTRQLRYSIVGATRRSPLQSTGGSPLQSLDMVVFINGLPIATFELKNKLTKQTVDDAVRQYKNDRDEKELLFQFGRCAVHFAVDDHEVRMCTHLKGKSSWFLPFNKGYNDGAGNPPNPAGIAVDYLWKEILTIKGLTDILENYAQVVEEKDDTTGRKKRKQIFPRYHQLKVVRMLLADAQAKGAGRRYLIQHSAGSGKSNSIAWLAHQLVNLQVGATGGSSLPNVFDSVIVVTDRRVLDKQIRDTIRQFAQVSATVGHAEHSGDLRKFLKAGKKIIITTVQKFPFILDEIGDEHRKSRFAILIDEAHSSQGGKATASMNRVLEEITPYGQDDEETVEDRINRIMESRKMLTNAAYFAFTATPKNKTLEIFGEPAPQPDGTERAIRYFHAFKDYLNERKSPYQPIVAFSGEHEYGGTKVTEATLVTLRRNLSGVRATPCGCPLWRAIEKERGKHRGLPLQKNATY